MNTASGGDCALQALQTRAASVADAPGGGVFLDFRDPKAERVSDCL